jgi:hypothetical protein
MANTRPVTWPDLLGFQARVVSRRQAEQYGISKATLHRRIRSGAWQRMDRATYATFSGVPPREARLWSALLRAGQGAVLSHETAAELHGLIDKPSGKIHVTVPANRDPAKRRGIRGVIIHRSRNVVSERLPPWEPPRTPAAETVLDLVSAARDFDEAYNWLVLADGRRLASAAAIRSAMAARKRMRWRAWLDDALTDVKAGVMSPLERRYVQDVERAHGLPGGRRQARRELGGGVRFLDNYYDDFRLCVELDGRLSHPPEQKWRDADRDSDNLLRDDIVTVRLGMPHVTSRRCEQAAKLAALFIRRGWNAGSLRACGPQCAVQALSPAYGKRTPPATLPRSNKIKLACAVRRRFPDLSSHDSS